MRRSALGRRIAKWSYSCAFVASLALLGAITALGQDLSRRGSMRPDACGPYPRLPGAVVTAPDWIGTDAPFDVARFFAAVPRDRNAAPLYLDALFEFGVEMDDCFPEGPERARRRQALVDRLNRFRELYKALREAPEAVPTEAVDAVIKRFEPGFRKLAEAQRRDRCLFEAGLGSNAPLPHIQVASRVARVVSLRVRRAVERQDFDAAICDVEAVLRLARDLQPRGYMISQMIVSHMSCFVCTDMLEPILASPGLRVEHCDRLLKVFLRHEASSSDGYTEGVRADYLRVRSSLRNPVRNQPHRAAPASPGGQPRQVRALNDYYHTLLGLDDVPYARRLDQIAALKFPEGEVPLPLVFEMTEPAFIQAFSQATGRMVASLHATECLIIMRRWQLTHRGLPRALLVAVKEAGLKAIPIDPYDGRPMRVALLGSPPVVYSVGKDGRDDGGQKDSKYDTQPGDLLYRMPPVQARR